MRRRKRWSTRSAEAVGDGVRPEGFTTITAAVTSVDGDGLQRVSVAGRHRRRTVAGADGCHRPRRGRSGWRSRWTSRRRDGSSCSRRRRRCRSRGSTPPAAYVSEADMEPCLDERPGRAVPAYSAAGDVRGGDRDVAGRTGRHRDRPRIERRAARRYRVARPVRCVRRAERVADRRRTGRWPRRTLKYPSAHDRGHAVNGCGRLRTLLRAHDRRASDSVAQSILALPHKGLLPVEVARQVGIRRENTHV